MKALLFSLITCLAAPAVADTMTPIRDRDNFLQTVLNKRLNLALFGVNLHVLNNGTITGTAMKKPVRGTWTWKGQHFCREMTWGSRPIEYSCQNVGLQGQKIHFTTPGGGKNKSATFVMR